MLWRGDENNTATIALALGLYDQEFKNLQEKEDLKIKVPSSNPEVSTRETVSFHLDFPKDEKLARLVHFSIIRNIRFIFISGKLMVREEKSSTSGKTFLWY